MAERVGKRRAPLFAAIFLALLAPSGAGAATVVNGDFESGNLSGWSATRVTEAGSWFAYRGSDGPLSAKSNEPRKLQPPPQGAYAATTDEVNPDTLILSQDIAVEPGSSQWLSLLVYYSSYAPLAVAAPDTLSVDDEVLAGKANQQYRIDLMRPEAPLDSVNPADILRTLFATRAGGPTKLAPTRISTELAPFAGQTVRLRIANAMTEELFNAGVDAVSISDLPPGGSPGSPGSRISNRFSFGRARANPKNGTMSLQVRVPGPGQLRARGDSARPPAAHPSSSRAVAKRMPAIKPLTASSQKQGTVTMLLKPTPAAFAILKRKQKLRVAVTVVYTPTGGSPRSEVLTVLLKLKKN